jgi:hypothetical protein
VPFSLLQVLTSLFLLLIIVQNAILKEMYVYGSTLFKGVKDISGSNWTATELQKDQKKYLCKHPTAMGTDPVTGVDTRESLMCLTTVNKLKNALTQQMYRLFGCDAHGDVEGIGIHFFNSSVARLAISFFSSRIVWYQFST